MLPRVLFAGGGTGGHLFPGVAVARALVARHRNARIVFAGTGRGVEVRILAEEGFGFESIRSAGLVGKSPKDILRAMLLSPLTFIDAIRILCRSKPDLVIGLGGYSAGPIVLLGALTGCPTMILEQNTVPGATNRWLALFVRAAAVSYDSTASYFGRKAFVSGNPVREGFFAIPPEVLSKRPRVLVIGGSQGAHSINQAMMAAAPSLASVPGGIEVAHQTGELDFDTVRDAYQCAGLDARVEVFFDAMDKEMHASDVVVCRAGATTLAEVAAAGRPALIVPLSKATHDHQCQNATVTKVSGAAEVVNEDDIDNRFTECLVDLITDGVRRKAMSKAAYRLAKPNATAVVVERAEKLMGCEAVLSG